MIQPKYDTGIFKYKYIFFEYESQEQLWQNTIERSAEAEVDINGVLKS